MPLKAFVGDWCLAVVGVCVCVFCSLLHFYFKCIQRDEEIALATPKGLITDNIWIWMAGERISFPLFRGSALSFGLSEVVQGFSKEGLSTTALWAHFMPLCSRLLTSPLTLDILNVNKFLWKHFRSDKKKKRSACSSVCAEIYTSYMQILAQPVMLVLVYLLFVTADCFET